MPKQILRFETDDGKVFDTLEQAEMWEQIQKRNLQIMRMLDSTDVDIPAYIKPDVLGGWLQRWIGALSVIAAGGTAEEALKEGDWK